MTPKRQIVQPADLDAGTLVRGFWQNEIILIQSPTTPIYVEVRLVQEPDHYEICTFMLEAMDAEPQTDDELIDSDIVEGSPATLRTIRQALQID